MAAMHAVFEIHEYGPMDVMTSLMLYCTMERLVQIDVEENYNVDDDPVLWIRAVATMRTLVLGEAARQRAWPRSMATKTPEGWMVTDGMLKKQPDLGRMGVDNEPDHE